MFASIKCTTKSAHKFAVRYDFIFSKNIRLKCNYLELCRLRLRILDLSSNSIAQLPIDLRLMTSLVELQLDWNPLVCPPAKICAKGRVHVFKWLRIVQHSNLYETPKRQEWSTPISDKMMMMSSSNGGGTLGRQRFVFSLLTQKLHITFF